jgi:two-component system, chemotaxis family, sensor kinase Cph1
LGETTRIGNSGAETVRRANAEGSGYRPLFEAVADGMLLATSAGDIIDANPQACALLGWTQDALVVAGRDEIFDASDPRFVVAMEERRETGRFKGEVRLLRRDGSSFPAEVSFAAYGGENGDEQTVIVFRDVTEREEAERRLGEVETRFRTLVRPIEELQRSNIELEQFAYVASHDLQEPLRMVASYTQLLARRYEGKLDADADEFIAYAVEGANRMQRLINDLLTYSRVGTRGRELAPTDSGEAFEAARANLMRAMEEAGAEVEVEGDLPVVMGDHTQLVQLFQNLIANAIKFRREGEIPRVRVGAAKRGTQSSEEGWLFWVSDNGIGMEAHYAERIFRIFQRLHARGEEYGGTGIGLAVCKKIVERHGGRIWVESEVGEGSTFYFTLRSAGKGDGG